MIAKDNPNKCFKIVLIGAGNVATHLCKAFKQAGNEIVQVYSLTQKSAGALASKLKTNFTDSLKKINPSADVYIVSVKDDAVSAVLSQIQLKQQAIIVHTSGSVPMNVFAEKFKNYGVFYPLQTFSKGKKVNFKNIPICLEANNKKTVQALKILAEQISDTVTEIDSEQRKKLHLAAVFSCNFSNYLYAISETILNENGMNLDLLKPLIKETAGKIKKNSPRKMQTGPAKRQDLKVMESHLKLLANHKTYQEIYKLLSEGIGKEL